MRLIDAEKYPCVKCGKEHCYQNCNEFWNWFNVCDYDLDYVINKIKDLGNIKFSQFSKPLITVEDVYNIVKAGVKNNELLQN